MAEFDAGEYGKNVADDYDAIYENAFDTAGTVSRLFELAAGGPVLELGVGTGRLALPLVERGLRVHGVDGSEQMLQLLHAKPGGASVASSLGDFSELRLDPPGQFSLVVLAINTIFALPDQDAQVRCFETAAHNLARGGRFVVEAWVPKDLPAGESLQPRKLSPGFIGLVVADHDPSRQCLETTQIVLGGETGVRVFPVVHRYAYPSELDLMARVAGLTLESRWQDWRHTSYGPASPTHVSVYRKTD